MTRQLSSSHCDAEADPGSANKLWPTVWLVPAKRASTSLTLQTSTQLQNFSRHRIPVLGCFHTHVQHHEKQAHDTLYVTAYGTPLLALKAIQQFALQIDSAFLTCRLATPLSSLLPAGVPPWFEHLAGGALGRVKDYVHRVKRAAGYRASVRQAASNVARELGRLENDGVIVDNTDDFAVQCDPAPAEAQLQWPAAQDCHL
ncbi:hypothetical protein HPB52_004258 [Rhipicephalus sanguineus]|uniref:Uncharacterized protein n=1 Tax=Rhipicephalus sanguineus TaxID=34632 RepID=A0A9D4Q775_RHISA|nr:hypothetical protein HPB52_004258 [Rhipicephalus sanguineus]